MLQDTRRWLSTPCFGQGQVTTGSSHVWLCCLLGVFLSDYGILACMVVLSAECFERLDRGVLLCPRKVGNLHGFGVLQQRSLGIGFKEKKCLGHGSEPLASLHL